MSEFGTEGFKAALKAATAWEDDDERTKPELAAEIRRLADMGMSLHCDHETVKEDLEQANDLIAELEDRLRWRKWDEEPPEDPGWLEAYAPPPPMPGRVKPWPAVTVFLWPTYPAMAHTHWRPLDPPEEP